MIRVLPRDAFNDANLLKCIGQLTLLIEDGKIEGLTYEYDGEPFDIRQDESDGSTYVANIEFKTVTGWTIPHRRNLNTRHNFPIIFVIDGEDYYPLNEKGQFQMDTGHFKKQQKLALKFVCGDGKSFDTYDKAFDHAGEVYRKTGNFISIFHFNSRKENDEV